MIYLASPYSHQKRLVRFARFMAVCSHAAEMMQEGALVFSPIAHGHPIAEPFDVDLPGDYWPRHNRATIYACEALHVLRLPGWKESEGIKREVEVAQERDLKIIHVDPSDRSLSFVRRFEI